MQQKSVTNIFWWTESLRAVPCACCQNVEICWALHVEHHHLRIRVSVASQARLTLFLPRLTRKSLPLIPGRVTRLSHLTWHTITFRLITLYKAAKLQNGSENNNVAKLGVGFLSIVTMGPLTNSVIFWSSLCPYCRTYWFRNLLLWWHKPHFIFRICPKILFRVWLFDSNDVRIGLIFFVAEDECLE